MPHEAMQQRGRNLLKTDEAWFSLRVREVPGSMPGRALLMDFSWFRMMVHYFIILIINKSIIIWPKRSGLTYQWISRPFFHSNYHSFNININSYIYHVHYLGIKVLNYRTFYDKLQNILKDIVECDLTIIGYQIRFPCSLKSCILQSTVWRIGFTARMTRFSTRDESY